ncbi:hypothetical protein MMPV_004990 [Pyropia vietnamensis]
MVVAPAALWRMPPMLRSFSSAGVAGAVGAAGAPTPSPPSPPSPPRAAAAAAGVGVVRPPRVRLPSLTAADFQHPLDAAASNAVRRLPLATAVMRGGLRIATAMLAVDNLTTAVRVSPTQLPGLAALLAEAAAILGIPAAAVPELYVRGGSVANAYTLAVELDTTTTTAESASAAERRGGTAGRAGEARRGRRSPRGGRFRRPAPLLPPPRRAAIVVTAGLVSLLTPAELQAVLGHELGHLLCGHSVTLGAGRAATLPLSLLPGWGSLSSGLLGRWARAAEVSGDRAALLVAQDPAVVASALMKLAGGRGDGGRGDWGSGGIGGYAGAAATAMKLEDWLAQAAEAEEVRRGLNDRWGDGGVLGGLDDEAHPPPVIRATEVMRWGGGGEYRALLRRGVPLEG